MQVTLVTDDSRQCGENYLEFPQWDLSKMGILPFICSITHSPLMLGTFYQPLWAPKLLQRALAVTITP